MADRNSTQERGLHLELTDEDMEKLATFDAAIDDEQMDDLERHAQLPCHGMNRRLALTVLARDSSCPRNLARDEPELFVEMYNRIDEYNQHVKAVAELMDKSLLRLLVVGNLHLEQPYLDTMREWASHETEGETV